MSLTVENLYFSYDDHPVLKGVSFHLESGRFLSLLGPNGAGKSTLLRCMLGLLAPQKGRTLIDGKDISHMAVAELARTIAYIPQSHSPIFNYSVMDMVLMGTTAQLGSFSSPGPRQKENAEQALLKLGIADLKHCGYQNISGGQRQMVLIARAIAQDARILMMDEPSSSLDFGNRILVMQTVKKLTEEGYTVVQSTHDPDQAFLYSDVILALLDGRVIACGSPKDTLKADLVSALYGVPVEVCSLRNDRIRVCIPAETGDTETQTALQA